MNHYPSSSPGDARDRSDIHPRSFAAALPIDRLVGLRPGAWIVVGPGFAREEVKALVLRHGALIAPTITGVAELSERIVGGWRRLESVRALSGGGGGADADLASAALRERRWRPSTLSPLARQEVLRTLLGDARVLTRTPELKRLRRQSGFYRRLDAALQGGRLAAASRDEELVYLERLEARLGENPIRREVMLLAGAYEAWLEGMDLWDPPRLIRRATEILRDADDESFARVRADLAIPGEICWLSGQTEESLEALFREALAGRVEVRRIEAAATPASAAPSAMTEERDPAEAPRWDWQRWHTLDDAAEALADELAAMAAMDADLGRFAVLIPDQAPVRRSLKRALAARGLPLEDPRDPLRLSWDETVKWALLPLRTAGRGYERDRVVAWLRAFAFNPTEFSEWIGEINARGIRQGLGAYAGGKLALVHSRLTELEDALGGRRTAAELAEGHLKLLRAAVGTDAERAWILDFLEDVWKGYVDDLARIGQAERRAPLRLWLERIEARISESPAPVERLKAESGVRVYRLSQFPLIPAERVFVLGLPPGWLTSEGAAVGDYWLSERDRETLCGEFAVRSAINVCRERKAALRHWLAPASEAVFLDAEYSVDGRERESILAALREIHAELAKSEEAKAEPELPGAAARVPELPVEPRVFGAHPRWSASFGAWRPYPPQSIHLPPVELRLGERKPVITATALDRYSRCGLQALAMGRWKLWDVREPEPDLWPDVKGNILHDAVRRLLASRDADGGFGLSPSEALDEAWRAKPPKGLLRGERIERYVRARLLGTLESFCAAERDYQRRAGTRTLALDEEISLRLEYDSFVVVGTPDRIEEHADGLFVMDYKTSSALPNGREMLDLGYRLQLPFYALAAQRQLGKPALGVQFIELTAKGGRGSGMFFAPHNGKEAGKLTHVRSNSKSLLPGERDEAWARVEASIAEHAKAWLEGRFEARPKKKDKECRGCAIADLCGLRRLSAEDDAAEGEGEATP